MRHNTETQRIASEKYLKLPYYIQIKKDVDAEAKFFAQQWKKVRRDKDKEFVILGLLKNGGRWDVLTRSLFYYPAFENYTKEKFPGLWQ